MDFSRLNPYVRHVGMYEVINRCEEHVSPDARLMYMVSGDVSVTVGAQTKMHLTSGGLLYIPAGVPYKMRGEYLRLIVISLDLTADYAHVTERLRSVSLSEASMLEVHICDLSPFDKMLHSPDMESYEDIFHKMYDIETSAEGAYKAELSAYAKLMLLKLAELVNENALPARMVESLSNYIRENCKDEISNTEVGAIFGYHPFYVSRVLKEKKGITLRQYIINYRLKYAKKLLSETKMSASEIAEDTGFTDASYFTMIFRQSFGMTPKEYRNGFKHDFI